MKQPEPYLIVIFISKQGFLFPIGVTERRQLDRNRFNCVFPFIFFFTGDVEPEFKQITIDDVTESTISLSLKLSLPDVTVNVTIKLPTSSLVTFSGTVDSNLTFQFVSDNLKPGTTYTILLEPKFEEFLGDPSEVAVTTKLANLLVEVVDTFRIETVTDGSTYYPDSTDGPEPDLINEGGSDEDLDPYYMETWIKVKTSIDGQFDNITLTLEPGFVSFFEEFSSNVIVFTVTDLTPGQVNKLTTTVQAGPWSVEDVQNVQLRPARPILISMETKIDNSIQIALLNEGMGATITFQIHDDVFILSSAVESFEKYKYIRVNSTFFGRKFRAFVSINGFQSRPLKLLLNEITFSDVSFQSFQEGPDLYMVVNFTTNSRSFDELRVVLDPDPEPGLRTFSAPETESGSFRLDRVYCGRDVIFKMSPYAGYSNVGPGFETVISVDPCADFSRMQEKVLLVHNFQSMKITVTIPFKGDAPTIHISFTDPTRQNENFFLTSSR